jgi:acetoin utilization deacetylase AcuC-like enzyme
MPVGFVYHPIYLEHDTGDHPENARRLVAVLEHLRSTGVWDRLAPVTVEPASVEDLRRVHSAELIESIRRLAEAGGGSVDSDTVVGPHSYEAALYAAGGTIAATDSVLTGQVSSAYALVRPPGHHATSTRAMGFCLFNNIAVAARWAMEVMGLTRLAIVDIDVHHGNGTADTFAKEPGVLYVSLHQYPLYPGTGDWRETGWGPGNGTTLNVALPPHTGDGGYRQAFERLVVPAVRRFGPELLMVSIGYDAHWADPLSFMLLSLAGYRAMMDDLVSLAGALCQGRIVVVLEGGYDTAVLAHGVAGTLASMMGEESSDPFGPAREPEADVNPLIDAMVHLHRLG